MLRDFQLGSRTSIPRGFSLSTDGFSELFEIVGGIRGDLIPYPSNVINSAAHSIRTQMTLDLSRHKTLCRLGVSFCLVLYSLTL